MKTVGASTLVNGIRGVISKYMLPVLVFCVLQGGGVTLLKCGEIYDMDFYANLMENIRQ